MTWSVLFCWREASTHRGDALLGYSSRVPSVRCTWSRDRIPYLSYNWEGKNVRLWANCKLPRISPLLTVPGFT
jgi:hypothetical protein